jgi:hypothetical protein
MRELAQARLAAVIAEKGLKPLNIESLREMGHLWPEDESVDDFLEHRERWRKESPERVPLDK